MFVFVGLGEGLDLYELENAPEMQKYPTTFIHDCIQLINQIGSLSVNQPFKHWAIQLINQILISPSDSQSTIHIVSQSVNQTKSPFHQSINHSNS